MSSFDLKRTPVYAESWNVAYRKKQAGEILRDTQTVFNIIKNSFRYWAADPFVFEHEGQTYIFAELYDYILRRGVLGYCKIENGKTSKWKPIIKEAYHLSYPCIMKCDGRIYIMPESGAGNELSLYEAEDFPNKWKKKKVLRKNVSFADTTPLPISDARLALTHRVDDPEKPQLVLADLDGKREDAVIADAEAFRSRPAGHIFEWQGQLVRPAQFSENCGDGYGKALIFCRCSIDGDMKYTETEIKELRPEQLKYDRFLLLDGMHTYNACEHYEVIDIKTRRFNLLNLFMRVAGKFIRR